VFVRAHELALIFVDGSEVTWTGNDLSIQCSERGLAPTSLTSIVRMKRSRYTTAAVFLACAAIAFLIRSGLLKTRRAHDDSARRALFVQTDLMLISFYHQHHRYPPTLAELAITNWPDGSSAATLSDFQYHSSGTSFTMRCDFPQPGSLYAQSTK
jgi:hypothetical protein